MSLGFQAEVDSNIASTTTDAARSAYEPRLGSLGGFKRTARGAEGRGGMTLGFQTEVGSNGLRDTVTFL